MDSNLVTLGSVNTVFDYCLARLGELFFKQDGKAMDASKCEAHGKVVRMVLAAKVA